MNGTEFFTYRYTSQHIIDITKLILWLRFHYDEFTTIVSENELHFNTFHLSRAINFNNRLTCNNAWNMKFIMLYLTACSTLLCYTMKRLTIFVWLPFHLASSIETITVLCVSRILATILRYRVKIPSKQYERGRIWTIFRWMNVFSRVARNKKRCTGYRGSGEQPFPCFGSSVKRLFIKPQLRGILEIRSASVARTHVSQSRVRRRGRF